MSIHKTPEEKQKIFSNFLKLFRATGLFHKSANAAGIKPENLRKWMEDDKEMEAQFEEVLDLFIEDLEDVAIGKAEAGKSDHVLLALLKAYKPDKYNPSNKVTLSGDPKGVPVQVMFSPDEIGEADLMDPKEVPIYGDYTDKQDSEGSL